MGTLEPTDLHITAIGKLEIAGVAIDLRDFFEAGQVVRWVLNPAVGCVEPSYARAKQYQPKGDRHV